MPTKSSRSLGFTPATGPWRKQSGPGCCKSSQWVSRMMGGQEEQGLRCRPKPGVGGGDCRDDGGDGVERVIAYCSPPAGPGELAHLPEVGVADGPWLRLIA